MCGMSTSSPRSEESTLLWGWERSQEVRINYVFCLVGKCVLDHFKFMSLQEKIYYKTENEKSWVTVREIVVAHIPWLCAGALKMLSQKRY